MHLYYSAEIHNAFPAIDIICRGAHVATKPLPPGESRGGNSLSREAQNTTSLAYPVEEQGVPIQEI